MYICTYIYKQILLSQIGGKVCDKGDGHLEEFYRIVQCSYSKFSGNSENSYLNYLLITVVAIQILELPYLF